MIAFFQPPSNLVKPPPSTAHNYLLQYSRVCMHYLKAMMRRGITQLLCISKAVRGVLFNDKVHRQYPVWAEPAYLRER